MNKAVLGTVAVAAIAAGGVGFASWSGGQVTSELQSQTAKIIQQFPGVKLIDQKITKGLVNSTHELTLQVGCDTNAAPDAAAAEPLQITWRDHIHHGPIPGGTNMGLASIDSELVLPPKLAAEVAKVFGDKPPFKAHTVLGFTGGYTTEITSPAVKHDIKDEGQLDWQGLTLVAKGNLKGGIAAGGSYTFDLPGLTFTNTGTKSPGSMKIGRMQMQGDIQPSADPALWLTPQKGTGSIASIAFDIKAPMGQPVNMLMSDLKFSGDSKIDKGLMSSTSQFGGKLNVNDFVVDQFDMQASMKNMHAATYQQMIGRMVSKAFSCQKPTDAAERAKADLEDMQKDLTALLRHDLEYSLDKLTVNIGGKTAELSYKFGTHGVTEADSATEVTQLLMAKGYVHSAAKVQTAWVEQVVKNVMELKTKQSSEKTTPEQLTQIMGVVNAAIDDMVTKGVLIRDADAVKTAVKVEAGQLTVNDKPMNPLELMRGM
jgi:hypothetical protein